MKTTLISVGVGLVLAGLGGGLAWNTSRSNRDLQEQNRKLEADLQVSRATVDALHSEKADAVTQLTQAQDLSKSLQTRIAESEAASAKEAQAAQTPPEVKPYQATAYLGRTKLGQAWIVPSNLRMDTNAQRYVYDPVIVLDESLRNSFVMHHTNIVEREVATTYVDNNYYPQPVYYFYGGRQHGTNRPPQNPPPQPPGPSPIPPQKFFQPSSTTTPQKLLIDAKDIKTVQFN